MAKSTGEKAAAARKRAADAANESAKQIEMELVGYKTGDHTLQFNIDVTGDTVWASQQQIADLYERDKRTISEHVQSVISDGELDENSVVRKFRTTATDGKTYEISHYDLDMILAVGFRVKSPKAAQFRKWAYQTLRSYIVDGYAINEARLRADHDATNKLAATLRGIRAEEQNIYASVREYFKESASDYDSKSNACRSFYALLQDKFHYAITGQTSSQIIMDRADHSAPNMGLQTMAGNVPHRDEITIGKNYLDRDELYTLHILCEQFLLFVQSKALRGQRMTMKELSKKLDDLLKVNDYPVFAGYKDYLKEKAVKHATAEFARFLVRLKQSDVGKLAAGGSF